MQQQKLALRVLIFSLIIVLVSGADLLLAQSGPRAASGKVSAKYVRLPLSFEPCSEVNCGPGHEGEFLARGPRGAVLIAPGEIAIALRSHEKSKISPAKFDVPALGFAGPRIPDFQTSRESVQTSFVRMKLLGANARAKAVAMDQLPGKVNYFIGNDPRKWRTDVPTYSKVRFKNVYPGIDLVYYGNGKRLEYDFVVAPGADPNAIRIALENGKSKLENGKWQIENRQSKIENSPNGDVVISTRAGDVRLGKPQVFQSATDKGPGTRDVLHSKLSTHNSELIPGSYVLTSKNELGFALGAYDHTRPLVIDPVLIYSTYLGGTGYDYASGIAVDSSGNAYVAGATYGTGFPTHDAIQGSNAGGADAFVTKLSAAGDAIVYSTYLGGADDDSANAIAVDSAGNAYLAGSARSIDFPTSNPIQAGFGGNTDAFVTKLNANGNALIYSTFLGGSSADLALGIALDSLGDAFFTGYTYSTDFPTLHGFQMTYTGGGNAAFVAEINAQGPTLAFSSYLGGGNNIAESVAVDSLGNSYVTGYADWQSPLPILNAIQPTYGGGGNDAFVTKISPGGSTLVYSTYLGGTGNDVGNAITVDSSDEVYVAGYTNSTDFPTKNPFQAANAGITDTFVAKLDAAGDALLFSTYLGGTLEDSAPGIAVDAAHNIYLTGYTVSSDFPSQTPVQRNKGVGPDAFVVELNASASALLLSTYFGGTGTDYGDAIAVDGSGNIYLSGTTYSADFPTLNPVQAAIIGLSDTFVAKLSLVPIPDPKISPSQLDFGSQLVGTTGSAQTMTITNIGDLPLTVTSITSSGDFDVAAVAAPCSNGGALDPGLSCGMSVTFKPTAAGARTGAVTITSNAPASPFNARLSGTGTDFSMAAQTGAATSATVTAGQTATYNLQLEPAGFSGQVQLGCAFQGSAPARAGCSVAPAAISLNGTDPAPFTVTVTTAGQSASAQFGAPSWPRPVLLLLMGAASFALLAYRSFRKSTERIPALRWAAPLGMLLLAISLWPACGSGGTTFFRTPAGNYKLIVTATAGGVSRTTSLTLKVN